MKNKQNILIIAAMLLSGWANAQEFKLAKSTGRLELHIGRVTVEGYSGNEIIFSSTESRGNKDERAQGLKAMSGSGLDDNTGLGINVNDKGNVIEVNQLKKTNSPNVKIMVPKGIIISSSFESEYGGDLVFRDLENEIEVSVNYNKIELKNITGPATIKSVYGAIEADFNGAIKDPISIVSVYGFVDVTLPLATKANLKLNTSYGEIFVAPEYKIDVDRKGGMVSYNDKLSGTINGGGINIDLTSSYGKIYLRKK